jgi:hypothetical protein
MSVIMYNISGNKTDLLLCSVNGLSVSTSTFHLVKGWFGCGESHGNVSPPVTKLGLPVKGCQAECRLRWWL